MVAPTKTIVPPRRVMPVACPNACGCTAVTRTPWAPPTAEQIGLIGTHWSRGWVIEDNEISHSVCSGIALGKHGDEWDNTSANTAEGYVKTIERGHARGWTPSWTPKGAGRSARR